MNSYQINPDILRRHRRSNLVQTIALLAALGGLLSLAGWIVAGSAGLIGGVAVVTMTPKIGPAVMLRMYGARELRPAEVPRLQDIVGDEQAAVGGDG